MDFKAHAMQDIAFTLLRIQEELSRQTVVMQQQLQAFPEKLEVLWDIGSISGLPGRNTFQVWEGEGSDEGLRGVVETHECFGIRMLRDGVTEAEEGLGLEWDQKRARKESAGWAGNDSEVE